MPDRNRTYLYLVSLTAATGGLLFGFDTGVIAGALPYISDQFDLDPHMEGFTVSNLIIGCIVGALISGTISDRWGRKPLLILSALLFIVSAAMSALAPGIRELIAARFIGGLAVGAASVLSPMYISEVAPKNIRGALGTFQQLAIVTGILSTYVTNWLLQDTGPANWRYMFAAENIPAVVFLGALLCIPESPRYLVQKGETKKAKAALFKLHGNSQAISELEEIEKSFDQVRVPLKEVLGRGRTLFVSAILLALFSQITGIDSVIYYAPKVLMRTGFDPSRALLVSVMVPLILLIFTCVAIFTIDRFGRRPLLIIGSLGMAVSFLISGFAFSPALTNGWLVLIGILLFIAFFAISLGPIPWIYISEIFPNRFRGAAVSMATIVLWASNFLVGQFFPWMIGNLEGTSYFIFSALCFLAFLFVLLMIRETRGLSLEEIENKWSINQ